MDDAPRARRPCYPGSLVQAVFGLLAIVMIPLAGLPSLVAVFLSLVGLPALAAAAISLQLAEMGLEPLLAALELLGALLELALHVLESLSQLVQLPCAVLQRLPHFSHTALTPLRLALPAGASRFAPFMPVARRRLDLLAVDA